MQEYKSGIKSCSLKYGDYTLQLWKLMIQTFKQLHKWELVTILHALCKELDKKWITIIPYINPNTLELYAYNLFLFFCVC